MIPAISSKEHRTRHRNYHDYDDGGGAGGGFPRDGGGDHGRDCCCGRGRDGYGGKNGSSI